MHNMLHRGGGLLEDYMYTIVYVLVDDEKLVYYNELMKSITSLRMHMPNQKVVVCMDQHTHDLLLKIDAEIINAAIVQVVHVPEGYNNVEKSRFIKVTLREYVTGDFLFIDTDTVICDTFPDVISDAPIGMVLELHNLRSIAKCKWTDRFDTDCGIDLQGYDYYFNSGVIWTKDIEAAHEFYREWHELWEETRKRGSFRDQPSLNSIVRKKIDMIDILDGKWNVQIATKTYSPINYLSDALIIHYMNNTWSPYKFCSPEIRALAYNDPAVIELLKTPKTVFNRCRIIALDEDNHYCDAKLAQFEKEFLLLRTTHLYRFVQFVYYRKRLFKVVESLLYRFFSFIDKMKHRR